MWDVIENKKIRFSKIGMRTERKKNRNSPENLLRSIQIRETDRIDGEQLYKLTELGLSLDGVRELWEIEKQIAEVYKMMGMKQKPTEDERNKQQQNDKQVESGTRFSQFKWWR